MTIESFGDQTGGRGLAYASRAGKQVGMMKPAVFDRVLQRPGQDLLPGYIFKSLRAPLAGNDLIGHVESVSQRFELPIQRQLRDWILLQKLPGNDQTAVSVLANNLKNHEHVRFLKCD